MLNLIQPDNVYLLIFSPKYLFDLMGCFQQSGSSLGLPSKSKPKLPGLSFIQKPNRSWESEKDIHQAFSIISGCSKDCGFPFPFSSIGLIKSTFKKKVVFGTAFLIDEKTALTCASNLHRGMEENAINVQLFLSYNFNMFECKVKDFKIPYEWKQKHNKKNRQMNHFDFALLELEERVGIKYGYFGLYFGIDQNNKAFKDAFIFGYSVSETSNSNKLSHQLKGEKVLWKKNEKNNKIMSYSFDYFSGLSGSPIFCQVGKNIYCIGMHCQQEASHRGILLNWEIKEFIDQWSNLKWSTLKLRSKGLRGENIQKNLKGAGSNFKEVDLSNNKLAGLSAQSIRQLGDKVMFLNISDNLIMRLESISQLQNLRILQAHANQIQNISPKIYSLSILQKLILNGNRITQIQPSIQQLKFLEQLNVSSNYIKKLPQEVGHLFSLKTLNISDNQIQLLPQSLGELNLLENLYCSTNRLKQIPEPIWMLENLRKFTLMDNLINKISPSVKLAKSLQTLAIDSNFNITFPDEIEGIKLIKLMASKCFSTKIPLFFSKLSSLKVLIIQQCQIKTISEQMSCLRLQSLDISNNRLGSVDVICKIKTLVSLSLTANKITVLSDEICNLSELKMMDCSHNLIQTLPSQIYRLDKLQQLDLSFNQLTTDFGSLWKLKEVRILKLSNNKGAEIPNVIQNLNKLQQLHITNCHFKNFPTAWRHLKKLKKLYLSSNELTTLELSSFASQSLQSLSMQSNSFLQLSPFICNLVNLKYLNMSSNSLVSLPPQIHKNRFLKTLLLHANNILELPEQIGDLQYLQSIDISANKLTSLPRSIQGLKKIEQFLIYQNSLKDVPKQLWKLRSILKLSISKNNLNEISPEIQNLHNLQQLKLAHNNIQQIPYSIGKLKEIKKIDISYNKIRVVPLSIKELDKISNFQLVNNPLSQQSKKFLREMQERNEKVFYFDQ